MLPLNPSNDESFPGAEDLQVPEAQQEPKPTRPSQQGIVLVKPMHGSSSKAAANMRTAKDVSCNYSSSVDDGEDTSSCATFNISWSRHPRVLLLIVVAIGFLTGNFFYAWPPTQVLYIRSGAYKWLCDSNEGSSFNNNLFNSLDDSQIFDFACDKQVQAIDSLMPTGVAAMFVLAFIGGLSIDYLGPKICAMMGLTFQICGWALLAFCNERFPFYLLANILMGFGNDPMYIALLDSSKLFPSYHQGTVIGLISASRSLSFVFPYIFNYLLGSYSLTIQSVYLSYMAILILCFLVVLFIFPWNCFPDPSSNSEQRDNVHFALSTRASRANRWNIKEGKNFDASFCSAATSVGSTYSISSQFRPSRVLATVPGIDLEASSCVTDGSTTLPHSLTASLSHSTTTAKSDCDSLWSVISSGRYLPLLPIAATTILSGTFFANSSRDQLGPALPLFVILTPFSFLPGVLMGYLSDIYRPLSVMGLMYLLSLLQFVLLLLEKVSPIPQYIAAIASFFVISFFLTQFYCYIALTFPRRHFGALSGFIVMCSGLLSLIVTPMCDFSSFAANYLPMNGLCLALTATNIFFLYTLYRNQKCPSDRDVKANAAVKIVEVGADLGTRDYDCTRIAVEASS